MRERLRMNREQGRRDGGGNEVTRKGQEEGLEVATPPPLLSTDSLNALDLCQVK